MRRAMTARKRNAKGRRQKRIGIPLGDFRHGCYAVHVASQVIGVHYGLGKRRRRFLRQVMADAAAHQTELVLAGKAFGVVLG